MAKHLVLTDDEYNSVMVTLREALEASFDPKHEELSVLYHTIGSMCGYEED